MCCHCYNETDMVPISTLWWSIGGAVLLTVLVYRLVQHYLLTEKQVYPRLCHMLENAIDWIGYWLQRLWYVCLFIASTSYVVLNFDKCRDLSFTSEFNGYNLIFVCWIILLILPLFEKFEGFGVSIKFRRQNEISSTIATQALASSNNPMTVDELEALHKKGGIDEQ